MKLKSPFKLEQQDSVTREEKSNNTENPSKISSSAVVGLRIVTDTSLGNSNIVFKPAFKSSLSDFRNNDRRRIGSRWPPTDETCFLKSCHLCRKELSLDKEVYMYRGDQGFCSRDCRERQIVLDEMREFELSTKRMLKSLRHRSADATSGRHEVRLLLEDLCRRDQPLRRNQNHWTIVS
ncbi:hypothetical protein GQ457_14G007600 [Hibiscus cannabinus]